VTHLIFYDGKCGLCDHAVQFLLEADKQQVFAFAPLQGTTAERVLKEVPQEVKQADSLILIENFETPQEKLYLFGKGALRACWLLGGKWRWIGWLSFLPAWLYDWGYRVVAKNRHRFFSKDVCKLPDPNEKKRFLP